MKMIIIFAALIAAVLAAPVDDSNVAQVLRYENDNVGIEGFKYGFETSDGISRDEQGELTDVGTDEEAIQVRGQFSYTGPDGVLYTVVYTAGKQGFVPSGDHIPTK
ncbi:flexible cuticle protein 12-like [Bradysia coprophila]|uniref:flexible cuticle protein 12-like n=1 Tax=Bradysia coprophila TaxID=38358 RepID=UPI00187DA8A9|nr:flexible cuticle protein 12-like [Bradysia coprophila]